MSEFPLVSILAVSYNHEKYCLEALNSVLNQNYPNIELIIVDDCSQDGTVEIIRKWIADNKVDCQFIAHSENQGTCKTYNEGMSYCKGKYYSTLSCDDILLPNKTSEQVGLFETLGDDVGMIYSDAEMFFENDPNRFEKFVSFHRKDDLKPQGNIFEELLERNFLPAMSCLIRTELFRKMGGFDEELLYEDYDFFLRLAKDYQVEYLKGEYVKYRMHDSNWHKSVVDEQGFHVTKGKMFLKFADDPRAYKQLVKLFELGDLARFQRDEIELVDFLRDSIREMNKLYHEVLMSLPVKIGVNLLGAFGSKKSLKMNQERFMKIFASFEKRKNQRPSK